MPARGCPAWLALLVAVTGSLNAVERIALSADRQPAGTFLHTLETIAGQAPSLAYDVATDGSAAKPVTLHLRSADLAAQRQAIAHAMSAWWALDDTQQAVLSRSASVPRGPLSARSIPGTHEGTAAQQLIRAAMAPWLGADAGNPGSEAALLADHSNNRWSATLDDDGHRQALRLLALLHRGLPDIPPWLPATSATTTDAPLDINAEPGDWLPWCRRIAEQAQCSVSLDSSLGQGATAPNLRCRGTWPEMTAQLAAHQVSAQLLHGVLCLSRAPNQPLDRQHPAQRRQLAIIPVPHLARDAADATVLANQLATRCGLTLPGWTIGAMGDGRSLLIAADVQTIHRVLAELAAYDRGERRPEENLHSSKVE